MNYPARITRQAQQHALVDGIPFQLPVQNLGASGFAALFQIDYERAAALLPGKDLHPVKLFGGALLSVAAIDYRNTPIGAYIEFSIGIVCTRSPKPAPGVLSLLFSEHYNLGQYVVDLPVSTEISVKGGKGIWGMPKHQASLDFEERAGTLSSQYDLDGRLAAYFEIDRPRRTWIPAKLPYVCFCSFRGMLMASTVYFRAKVGFKAFGAGGRFVVGDHPRMAKLAGLGISDSPLMTVYAPAATGVLDDHFEAWFLANDAPPKGPMQGMESVVDLGFGREWPAPPSAPIPAHVRPNSNPETIK